MAVLNIQNDKDSIETRNCYTVVFSFHKSVPTTVHRFYPLLRLIRFFVMKKKKTTTKKPNFASQFAKKHWGGLDFYL